MPYKTNKDLPDSIRNRLPVHAQDIYREAYNNASKQYQDPKKRRTKESLEAVVHKVAWSAVKQKYVEKDDKWVEK